jgi:hypothetical protein
MKYTGAVWAKVGEDISTSGGTDTSIAFDSNGKPYVAFKDNSVIRRVSVMKLGNPTGISNQLSKKTDFRIFPNPNKGTFTLEMSENKGNPFFVEIADVSGRTIFNRTFETGGKHTVELPKKEKGLYLVKIESGDLIFTKSVLIRN